MSTYTAGDVFFVEALTALRQEHLCIVILAVSATQRAPFLYIFLEPFRCPGGPP